MHNIDTKLLLTDFTSFSYYDDIMTTMTTTTATTTNIPKMKQFLIPALPFSQSDQYDNMSTAYLLVIPGSRIESRAHGKVSHLRLELLRIHGYPTTLNSNLNSGGV